MPALMALTTPALTVATATLLLLHVTFWLVALVGMMVGVRVSLPSTDSVVADLRDTPVTPTVAGAALACFTVTVIGVKCGEIGDKIVMEPMNHAYSLQWSMYQKV